ncbi:LuxR C-terminal-related transcriptional regulator [Lentzea sp. NPDC005914]|uniref:LuxR C-terminal-related transcriptional regulator n=1 Tax=Lentzea sp. NPDC005914 TaxID=3154572 RepID=UPI003402D645
MFDTIGLSENDLAVYRYVARHLRCTTAEVADALGVPLANVIRSRELLCAKGLLVVGEDDTMLANPAGPEIVLEQLRAGIDAEYSEKRKKAATLHGQLTQVVGEGLLGGSDGAVPPVEVLVSRPAIHNRMLALAGHTRRELLRMYAGPAQGEPVADIGGEFRTVRPEVDVRVIFPSSTLLGAGAPPTGTRAGLALRVVSSPPAGLHVFDRRVAVVESTAGDTSFVVHGNDLVRVLHAFFETWWALGRAARSTSDGAGPNEEELVLLQFLSEGAKDEHVARRLGLSVRTVRRKISYLLEQLDASSRFQAGVLAARRGWI